MVDSLEDKENFIQSEPMLETGYQLKPVLVYCVYKAECFVVLYS